MDTRDIATKSLEEIAQELGERDQANLAERVGQVIAMLRNGTVPVPYGGVMTTGEAAKALGISSINTIKRWAGDGILEGFRRGGRIMVSRRSVERMLESPAVARQKDWERELDEALAPFDFGDADLPPTGNPWIGRKPWDPGAKPDG